MILHLFFVLQKEEKSVSLHYVRNSCYGLFQGVFI